MLLYQTHVLSAWSPDVVLKVMEVFGIMAWIVEVVHEGWAFEDYISSGFG